jgi:hypothetical protein
VPALPAVIDKKPPAHHHLFIDGQGAAGEHRPELTRQPIDQVRPTRPICEPLDAEAKLREGHHADVQRLERLSGDEGDNPLLRPRTAKLEQDIGVEQPAFPKSTSRTDLVTGSGSRSMSRYGEA